MLPSYDLLTSPRYLLRIGWPFEDAGERRGDQARGPWNTVCSPERLSAH